MAQKVLIQLVDDLDGSASEDITTVTFGLDGANYEIDLTANNAAKLRNSSATSWTTRVGLAAGLSGAPHPRLRCRRPTVTDQGHPGLGPAEWLRAVRPRPYPLHRHRGVRGGTCW
jgi:hypothetical protein